MTPNTYNPLKYALYALSALLAVPLCLLTWYRLFVLIYHVWQAWLILSGTVLRFLDAHPTACVVSGLVAVIALMLAVCIRQELLLVASERQQEELNVVLNRAFDVNEFLYQTIATRTPEISEVE